MRAFLALGLACLWATAAPAADKVLYGPAPAWVKPAALPADAKPDEAAIRLLLHDEQVAVEPSGIVRYSQVALRIQTPQGLAAGNVSVPWRPDTDELTVHKLQIRRGDQLIDVLASGQTFTIVRRETNLESAALDGVLTANIQPEGLQVGDILEFAASVRSNDPVLKGHFEHVGGAWNMAPVSRARLRVQWPSSLKVRLRQSASLPALKPVERDGTTSVELSQEGLEPLNPPKGAPPRFQLGRMVEFTDYASWSDLAALMAPLYVKAAALPADGPLQAELARIKALSPDPKVRAEAALALVQDRVRYVALSMGQGGYVPADAATTWSRRFGDCKGKTALLLGFLHALGIAAEPVAVNAIMGDGIDERLPMVGMFNHVLVRARLGGRAYWLDGTRTGDRRLDAIRVPAFGWGLPLVPGGALVRIMPAPLDRPDQDVSIRIDATAGIEVPAPARIEMVIRGDAAIAGNLGLANLTGDAKDRALRDYWKEHYDFIDVKSATTSFDAEAVELRFMMEGQARMEWRDGFYETNGTGLGYKADFSREAGPGHEAPFAVAYPFYTRTAETILLPPGFKDFKAGEGANVEQTIAGVEYRRRASLAGNVFTVEAIQRSIAPEFSASEAAAAQAALRKLADQAVYLRVPNGYRPTEKEVAAALTATPTTAAEYFKRGRTMLETARYAEAISDFDRAAALDPENAWTLANRGIARVWIDDIERATKDLNAAAALDARNPVVFRARGLLAQRNNAPSEAVAAYTTALEIDPNSAFALGHRAEAYNVLGEADRALADAAAAIKLRPNWIDLYLLRANLLRRQGKHEATIAEAVAMTSANPDASFAHVAAARIYDRYGKTAEAMRAFDRALAIKPEAYIYINRAEVRPKADLAGRRADIDAALALDPTAPNALVIKAATQTDAGDHKGALATLSAAIEAEPEDSGLLVERGLAHARAGSAELAERDFAAAHSKATEPVMLNNMCWKKATAGLALESALKDCDAALAKRPDTPGFLDSRGLVLLRLGRLEEAIATYDKALAKAPALAGSLFGRALAWARKGNKSRSDADRAAAVKANSGVLEEFSGYGLKL